MKKTFHKLLGILLSFIMAVSIVPLIGFPVAADDAIDITIATGTAGNRVGWWDTCATKGYWGISARDGVYNVFLANKNSTQAAGNYEWSDMDPDACFLIDDSSIISFTGGSCTVTVSDKAINVAGTFTGEDEQTYNIDLTYSLVPLTFVLEFTSENDTVCWEDSCATENYWYISGENAEYSVELSNNYSTLAAGVYAWDDLDSEFCYLFDKITTDLVVFVDGSCTVTVNGDDVNVAGTFSGDDGNTYEVDITYSPSGETVELTYTEEYDSIEWYDDTASGGYWAVYAENSDYSVSLGFKSSSRGAAGEYAWSDLNHFLCSVRIASNNSTVYFNECNGVCKVTVTGNIINISGTFPGEDGKFYAVDITGDPRNDIYEGTVDVDTEKKTVTVTVDETLVPASEYHVIFFTYEKIEGGESLVRVGTEFPTEPGTYIAAIVAEEDSEDYKGQGRSEPFTIADPVKLEQTGITGTTKENGVDTWQKGSNESPTVTIKDTAGKADNSFELFGGVKIDGEDQEEGKDYTKKEGSTIITLLPAALEKLAAGAHKVEILFENGKVEVALNIKEAPSNVPATGDSTNLALWIILIAAAALVLTFLMIEKKRRVVKN